MSAILGGESSPSGSSHILRRVVNPLISAFRWISARSDSRSSLSDIQEIDGVVSQSSGVERRERELEDELDRKILGRLLWLAAKHVNVDDVSSLLEQRAPVDYELPSTSERALLYKQRRCLCQAIHAAASYNADADDVPCPEERREDATRVVQLLLSFRADATAKAEIGTSRRCEAIHFASGSGNVGVVSLLLKNRASPNAEATLLDKSGWKSHYMPLHDAVWFNRRDCLRLLLDSHADIKARNVDDNTGLHLAAELGYSDIARELILGYDEEMVEVISTGLRRYSNSSRNSCLSSKRPHERPDMTTHVRPSLRYAPSEGLEAEAIPLEKALNKNKKTPLDMAIESGQFPPRELWLFTYNLSDDDRASAFVKVAHRCPSAASALLRSNIERDDTQPYDEDIVPIDEGWKHSLQQGAAERGLITPLVLASLIQKAPQAAVDLLEALTDYPHVNNPQANPLPIRARISSSNMIPLHAAYEADIAWEWNSIDVALFGAKRGAKSWQRRLAPKDPQGGQEVRVRILKLPGVINLCVIHSLACTADYRLFSMLQVHALLCHLWKSCFRLLFVVDVLHEAVTLSIISSWVFVERKYSTAVNEALWCFVVAQSMTECSNYAAVSWNCRVLGSRDLFQFWRFSAHELLVPFLTLFLAYIAAESDYFPTKEHCITLSVTIMIHWLRMLYQLRAFRWPGQRLLPVLRSIHSIHGMLVILAFLAIAFVHAFWALDIDRPRGLAFYEVSVMMMSGDPFIDSADFESMDESKRVGLIVLVLLALFLVLACALNVFIAVLGDCYDLEQERLICTFMMERAKICCSLFLRPSCSRFYLSIRKRMDEWTKTCCSRLLRPSWCRTDWSTTSWRRPWRMVCVFVAAVVVITLDFALVVLMLFLVAHKWISALVLTVAMLSLHLVVRSSYAHGEEERFLWMCHGARLQDNMHLRCDFNDMQDESGRMLRMKQFVFKQSKFIDEKISELARLLAKGPGVAKHARQFAREPDLAEQQMDQLISIVSTLRDEISLARNELEKQSITQGRLEVVSADMGMQLEQVQLDLCGRMELLEKAIQRMSAKRQIPQMSKLAASLPALTAPPKLSAGFGVRSSQAGTAAFLSPVPLLGASAIAAKHELQSSAKDDVEMPSVLGALREPEGEGVPDGGSPYSKEIQQLTQEAEPEPDAMDALPMLVGFLPHQPTESNDERDGMRRRSSSSASPPLLASSDRGGHVGNVAVRDDVMNDECDLR